MERERRTKRSEEGNVKCCFSWEVGAREREAAEDSAGLPVVDLPPLILVRSFFKQEFVHLLWNLWILTTGATQPFLPPNMIL